MVGDPGFWVLILASLGWGLIPASSLILKYGFSRVKFGPSQKHLTPGRIRFLLDVAKAFLGFSLVGFALNEHFGLEIIPVQWWVAIAIFTGEALIHRKGKLTGPALGLLLVLSPFSAMVGIAAYFIGLCIFENPNDLQWKSQLFGVFGALLSYLTLNAYDFSYWMIAFVVLVILGRYEPEMDAHLEGA